MYDKIKILVVASLLGFFFSCKKNESKLDVYYMIADINGSQTNYTRIFADTLINTNFTSTFISATNLPTYNYFVFQFMSFTHDQLQVGTYTGTNTYRMECKFYNYSTSIEYKNIGYSNFTVTIDDINSTFVKGRFNGILRNAFNVSDSVIINNGDFIVPYFN